MKNLELSRKKTDISLSFITLIFQKKIRLQRVLNRNSEKGETFEFEVSKDNFDFMENWFETPSKKELENAIIVKS